jgi:uncharacterized metal-binding protein
MPDGKVHNAVTWLTAGYIVILSPLYLPHTGPEALFMVPGCLTGLLVTPDLDVDYGTESAYLIKKNLGHMIMLAWLSFWWPYSRIFPHRHWGSHVPVISTFIRMGYICLFTLGYFGTVIWLVQQWGFWYWFLGLCLADFHHWFMDVVTRKGD